MKKQMVRIKTREENFLCAINLAYGKYLVFWATPTMELLKLGSIEEWVWATTSWDNPAEKGEWELPSPLDTVLEEEYDCNTAYFQDAREGGRLVECWDSVRDTHVPLPLWRMAQSHLAG